MANINQEAINYVIMATNQTDAAINAATSGVKRMEQQTEDSAKRMSAHFETFKKNWLAATAAITASLYALSRAWAFAEQAAQFEQSKAAFRSMAQSMGADADRLYATLREKSAGLIDQKSLVESANRAMSLGIPIEKLGDLLEVARAKARDMGISTTQAFNDIATGIGRASPLILDNLGLALKIGAANEAMARSLGKTAEELTEKEKKMAVLNATLEAGREALRRYDLALLTTKERMEKLRATVADLQLFIGTMVIRGFGPIAGIFQGAGAAAMIFSSAVLNIGRAFAWTMSLLPGKFGDYWTGVSDELRKAAQEMAQIGQDWAEKGQANIKLAFAKSADLAMAMRPQLPVDTGTGGPSPEADKKALEAADRANIEAWGRRIKAEEEYKERQKRNRVELNEHDAKKAEEKARADATAMAERLAQQKAEDEALFWMLEETENTRIRLREQKLKLETEKIAAALRERAAMLEPMFNLINATGGELGVGVGQAAAGMKGLAEAIEGFRAVGNVGKEGREGMEAAQNPYAQKYAEALAYFSQMEALFESGNATLFELTAAANAATLAHDQATNAARIAMAQHLAGVMAGTMYSLYAATGQTNEGMFKLYQAAAIAEATVSTYNAAQKAFEWGMKGGPPLAFAMAAMAVAAGLARVQAIASQKIGGGMATAASPSGGGGYAYSSESKQSLWQPKEETRKAPIVNIAIYGDVLNNHDELARKIVEPLQKAWSDNVH